MRTGTGKRKRAGQVPDRTAGSLAVYCSSLEDLDDVVLNISTAKSTTAFGASRDSYLVIVQAGSSSPEKLFIKSKGGSKLSIALHAGQMCILDIDSVVLHPSPSEWILHYLVPQRSLRSFAAYRSMARIDSLHCHVVYSDPILYHMSRAMKSLLEERSGALEPLGDSFARSFYSHILDCYGRRGFASSEARGGLTNRHKRVIDETLVASLGKEMRLGLLSARCGLSPGYFSRAFRKTYGLPFHQYLISLRIRRAKDLLRSTALPIPVIAARVGYANQATFTESFTAAVGTSPGRFRRSFLGMHVAQSGEGFPLPMPVSPKNEPFCQDP